LNQISVLSQKSEYAVARSHLISKFPKWGEKVVLIHPAVSLLR
jgi:hypothetical protein